MNRLLPSSQIWDQRDQAIMTDEASCMGNGRLGKLLVDVLNRSTFDFAPKKRSADDESVFIFCMDESVVLTKCRSRHDEREEAVRRRDIESDHNPRSASGMWIPGAEPQEDWYSKAGWRKSKCGVWAPEAAAKHMMAHHRGMGWREGAKKKPRNEVVPKGPVADTLIDEITDTDTTSSWPHMTKKSRRRRRTPDARRWCT
ncbi:hypothetical protein EJ06DRAFT_194378 [Trichodelitschia bisporula]|uniref:Uncharacterized protein n=1 Tax=Trichodelitschia bisporula TaxID=703511 RepID=A0A6G1I7M0_9PEZI|nr:hypothetical protein EJ06DRAFT_194378 [Trichodelitschia bisporula]